MQVIGGIIVLLVILGGGYYVYDQNQTRGDAMEEKHFDGDGHGHDDDAVMEKDGEAMEEKGSEAMEEKKDGEAMMEEGPSVSFNVSGVNFAFSETEIRVKEGDKVTINFTSTDGFHDWVVDEFFAATDRVSTGGSSSVTFTADKKGEFEYYCSVGNHRAQGMVGTLIVE